MCIANGRASPKLGVVWYRVPNESHNEDGKHIKYLLNRSSAFRDCDPKLFDSLQEIFIDASGSFMSSKRRVETIEHSDVLPSNTIFYGSPLSYERLTSAADRIKSRRDWFERALAATSSADLIFLDPDNGVECKSVSQTQKKGPKYVYWEELTSFAKLGQSVLTYHHLNFSSPTTTQVKKMLQDLQERLPIDYTFLGVIYRRGTRRAFFLAVAPKHASSLCKRFSNVVKGPWARHFCELSTCRI